MSSINETAVVSQRNMGRITAIKLKYTTKAHEGITRYLDQKDRESKEIPLKFINYIVDFHTLYLMKNRIYYKEQSWRWGKEKFYFFIAGINYKWNGSHIVLKNNEQSQENNFEFGKNTERNRSGEL